MQPVRDTTVAHRKRTVPTDAELSDRISAVPTATADAEFMCETCGARCTETPQGTELGHQYDCPERPDWLPGGGGCGSASRHGGDA